MAKVIKKKGKGAPSKYKKVYCEGLVAHMKDGLSFESYAAIIDVHRDTLYEWVKVHKDFSDAKKKAVDHCMLFWERVGVAGATGKLPGFQTGAWVFNMKNRFSWTDRQELTVELSLIHI